MYWKRFLQEGALCWPDGSRSLNPHCGSSRREGERTLFNNKSKRATNGFDSFPCTFCPSSLPASPIQDFHAVLGKMSQYFGHTVNGPVGISPFRMRSNFHAFQPVVCDGQSLTAGTPWRPGSSLPLQNVQNLSISLAGPHCLCFSGGLTEIMKH